MFLFRDQRTGELTGSGYARFATNREASVCIRGAAENDVVATWSESERASKRLNSAYGFDVHTAFANSTGQVKTSILLNAKLKEVVMHSQSYGQAEKPSPMPEAKQLHFSA